MLTAYEFDRKLAVLAAERTKDTAAYQGVTPTGAHDAALGILSAIEDLCENCGRWHSPEIHEQQQRDISDLAHRQELREQERDRKRQELREQRDRQDPDVEKGKGWKKLVRQLLQDYQPGEAVTSGEFPRDLQPTQDGVSRRPVHDGVVPYEDRPGDEAASLPFRSTAPVLDPDTGKSYDFLNSVRLVTGPQDIGAGGLFTKTAANMQARRDPGVNTPGGPQVPGHGLGPQRTGPQHHVTQQADAARHFVSPGCSPAFRPPPVPAGIRRPFLAEGTARNSPSNKGE